MLRRLLLLLVLACSMIPAQAQGCNQCRETIGQTSARTRTAYRRGIALLVFAGVSVFGGALVVLRRYR